VGVFLLHFWATENTARISALLGANTSASLLLDYRNLKFSRG
jgi:hypothetical protein